MDDDIEILDVFNDKAKEIQAPVKKVTRVEKNGGDDMPKKKKSKKRRVKTKSFQILFCSISALFILGCCVFYGSRFIKYYRIYNPKAGSSNSSVLLAKDIVGKSEFATGDEPGLFSSSGNYIYKGEIDNNYLKYNNMLWRIIRINADNSLDIILDDYINLLPWNNKMTTFTESDVYKYLNDNFLNSLDKEMLSKTSFCTDEISDLTKITCEKQNSDNYVKLLDVANFLNSVKNSKSYLVNSEEIMWLSDAGNDKTWHTNGVNVSQSDSNNFYEIRPVVRLKNTVFYTKGDGTKDNPYLVGDDNKLTVGSKVLLGEDKWIVYEISDNIKLMSEKVISKQLDFDQEKLTYKDSTLMDYLNTTYLDSLSYKDMIIDDTWYIGSYKNNLNDIKENSLKTKVGIPNILDIKFDSQVTSYFLSTSMEDKILVYSNPIHASKVTIYRNIRPCITISKENISKLKNVDGIFKIGE